MATPKKDDFQKLQRQIDKITAVLTAQANYLQLLNALAAPPPAPPESDDKLYTKAEAIKYCTVSRSTFDKIRKELDITPEQLVKGKYPRFTRSQCNLIREQLFHQDE